jgi:hypothetical protein
MAMPFVFLRGVQLLAGDVGLRCLCSEYSAEIIAIKFPHLGKRIAA